MIKSPPAILAILLAIVALVTRLSGKKSFEKFFRYLPAPLWCYFLPTALSTLGVLPSDSPLYSWMSRYVLPACLILLLIGTDVPSILRLSPRALSAMAAGSFGILIGGIATFLIYYKRVPEFWRGWACLSASWTGGSVNMLSAREILKPAEQLFANLIIVDTIMAYSWMAVLVYISKYRAAIDRFLGAQDLAPEEYLEPVSVEAGTPSQKLLETGGLLIFAFAISSLFWLLSGKISQILAPICSQMLWTPPSSCLRLYFKLFLISAIPQLSNRFTILIVLSTFFPLFLSLTPAKRLESLGASRVGNFLLYLLLTSIGARGDLTALAHAPFLIALGFIWVLLHGLVLFTYGKMSRTPIAILAAASQANIGGTVSTPLVATVYDRRLAPMGLILAVLGNIYGTFFAILFAGICRRLSLLL